MEQTLERTREEWATLRELLRELEALGPEHKLTSEEFFQFANRIPPMMPENWTSADDIRDFRGPLPDDDPEYHPHMTPAMLRSPNR